MSSVKFPGEDLEIVVHLLRASISLSAW